MFRRFSSDVRKVQEMATQEALRFNHEYFGTEHVLLGLLNDSSSHAVSILRNLGVVPSEVKKTIERLVQSGPDSPVAEHLPQTPCVTRVLEYAKEEARSLKSKCLDTEHVLLGLLRERPSVGNGVLTSFGLTYAKVREETLAIKAAP